MKYFEKMHLKLVKREKFKAKIMPVFHSKQNLYFLNYYFWVFKF